MLYHEPITFVLPKNSRVKETPTTTPLVCGVFLYLHLKGNPWQWRPNKPKHKASTPEATPPPRSQQSKPYKNHENTGITLTAGASDTNAFTAPRLTPYGRTPSTANYMH